MLSINYTCCSLFAGHNEPIKLVDSEGSNYITTQYDTNTTWDTQNDTLITTTNYHYNEQSETSAEV